MTLALQKQLQQDGFSCHLNSIRIYLGNDKCDLGVLCRLIARTTAVTSLEMRCRGFRKEHSEAEVSFAMFEKAIGCKLFGY